MQATINDLPVVCEGTVARKKSIWQQRKLIYILNKSWAYIIKATIMQQVLEMLLQLKSIHYY